VDECKPLVTLTAGGAVIGQERIVWRCVISTAGFRFVVRLLFVSLLVFITLLGEDLYSSIASSFNGKRRSSSYHRIMASSHHSWSNGFHRCVGKVRCS
jgi:hypothetical protein